MGAGNGEAEVGVTFMRAIVSKERCDISKVLEVTWKSVEEELPRTPVCHWNESVFRFFFVRALLGLYGDDFACTIEWNRIDLLIQRNKKAKEADNEADNEADFVEFKFHVQNSHRTLAGTRTHLKGGPGKKNFTEFRDCVEKLSYIDRNKWFDDEPSQSTKPRIARCFLILAYAQPSDTNVTKSKSYDHWYEKKAITLRLKRNNRKVVLKPTLPLLENLPCKDSDENSQGLELKCKLFEIQKVRRRS